MFQFLIEVRTRSSKSVSPLLSLMETIVEVEFKKRSRSNSMYYKTSFEGESKEVDFLRPRFSTNVFPQTTLLPRSIPLAKKDGTIDCLKGVPRAKLIFWRSLMVNEESRDLAEFLS